LAWAGESSGAAAAGGGAASGAGAAGAAGGAAGCVAHPAKTTIATIAAARLPIALMPNPIICLLPVMIASLDATPGGRSIIADQHSNSALNACSCQPRH